MCDWPTLDKWAYVGVVNSVGFVRQSSGMKDVSVLWVLVNSMGLASLVGLHCTDEGQQPETSKWMSAVCPDIKYSFAYRQLISNLLFIDFVLETTRFSWSSLWEECDNKWTHTVSQAATGLLWAVDETYTAHCTHPFKPPGHTGAPGYIQCNANESLLLSFVCAMLDNSHNLGAFSN